MTAIRPYSVAAVFILTMVFTLIPHLAFSQNSQFKFTILTNQRIASGTRIEARLSERVSMKDLRKASILLRKEVGDGPLTIFYYLPHQTTEKGAWAIGQFKPDLHIEIRLATIEQIRTLKRFSIKDGWKVPLPPSKTVDHFTALEEGPNKYNRGGQIIGEYVWELPSDLSHKITIFKNGPTYMMNEIFLDGGQTTRIIKVSNTQKGMRIDIPGLSAGDYFVLNPKGMLESWDDQGLIEVFPLQKDVP